MEGTATSSSLVVFNRNSRASYAHHVGFFGEDPNFLDVNFILCFLRNWPLSLAVFLSASVILSSYFFATTLMASRFLLSFLYSAESTSRKYAWDYTSSTKVRTFVGPLLNSSWSTNELDTLYEIRMHVDCTRTRPDLQTFLFSTFSSSQQTLSAYSKLSAYSTWTFRDFICGHST